MDRDWRTYARARVPTGCPETRKSLRWGQTLVLRPAAQLLWLLCCLASYLVVARSFQYQGFVVVTPVSASRLLAVAMTLVGLSFLLPGRLANPADYVVVGLFDISFTPFCTYWALSSQPWWQWLLMTAYWGLVLFVSGLPVRLPVLYVRHAESAIFLVVRGLLLVGVILVAEAGHLTLHLPLESVYAVRSVWASEGSWMSKYLFPWLAHIVLPLLLVHAWKNRRLSELALLILVAYLLFTSTGMRTWLFMPFFVVAVLWVSARRSLSSIVPVGLSVFAGCMVMLDSITRSVTWSSLGIRRVLLVPALLTSAYLDFFSSNPVIRMSDSILFRGWLQYPYPLSVSRMIGSAIGEPGTNANTGLAADGFANFGLMGSLVWAVLLGLLMHLLRAATDEREKRPEAWAVAAMWPLVLVDSGLTTSLLTHGLALGLLVAWSLRPKQCASESRNSAQDQTGWMESFRQPRREDEP